MHGRERWRAAIGGATVVLTIVTGSVAVAPSAVAEPPSLPGFEAGIEYVTAAGARAWRYYSTVGSVDDAHFAQVVVPETLAVESPVQIVIAFHGATATEDAIVTTDGARRMLDSWLDRGWVVIAPRGGSTIRYTSTGRKVGRDGQWGNQRSSAGVADLWQWATTTWSTDPHGPLLYGWSMGGVAALNVAAELDRRGSAAAAVFTVDGVAYLRGMYVRSTSAARSMRKAYLLPRGTTAGNEAWVAAVDVADGGHDPIYALPNVTPFPLRMSASAGDPTVNATQNSYFLRQQLSSVWSEELIVVATSGGHNANGHYDPIDTNAFFDRALARKLAPYASFGDVVIGADVAFDASVSSDPDGSIVDYAWDFGDGSTGTVVTPNHTYATSGSFTVTLTVTDDNGLTASTSRTITVAADEPPVAAFSYSVTGLAVDVDATTSSDSDGVIVDYAWDFGDADTGSGETATHTYATPGTYIVTLSVIDDRGEFTMLAVAVIVDPPPMDP
jgi:PKD repeat protein